MAKSARASITKKNHRELRRTVFGPVHDARTARLSEKLLALATKPQPETEKAMDVDGKGNSQENSSNGNAEEMDVDAQGMKIKPDKTKSTKDKSNHKAHKISKRKKPRNSIVFASEVARRKKAAGKKSKR